MLRNINKIIDARPSSDGDGVKIYRSIGSYALTDINPFLLLDELHSDDAADYVGGFPSHPHRGFETVTYMLEGQMRHKDSAGNEGVISSGDLQWMTAGSGIIHSEMPEQSQGRLRGFQFWINLPADQKMRAPRYQEIATKDIPEILLGNGKVRVLAGEVSDKGQSIQGAASDIATQPLMLDVQLEQGHWQAHFPERHVAFVYVYRGALTIGQQTVNEKQLAVLSSGDSIILASNQPTGALLLAAAPLDEPIARYGPFVMNTQEEINQAVVDYRNGSLVQLT